MSDFQFGSYNIDAIEIYTPMAKALSYWHERALGFTLSAYANYETGMPDVSSYVLTSGNIRLVLTSVFPTANGKGNTEVSQFIGTQYCGVKRVCLEVDDVKAVFAHALQTGAIPLKFPVTLEDEEGTIEEAGIKLYDNNEITFISRVNYTGAYKPGYRKNMTASAAPAIFKRIDHVAAEVRINEISYWSDYLTKAIGTRLVQRIQRSEENRTGMILNINQSPDTNLTLVMAEPESYLHPSKVQQNINLYGPGIHHIALATDDLAGAVTVLRERGVEFVRFPASYYTLLRENEEFRDFDIDMLEAQGILIDKEDDTYLLQKFTKPISDRPFFLYELVQRVNGYNGFALKNINVLKKAEELEIMKTV